MKEIITKFPVKSATIYPQSALLTRTNLVDLEKGGNKLIITDLPANLTEDSVRIELEPGSATRILDVSSEDLIIPNFDKNRFHAAKKVLDDLLFKQQQLEAAIRDADEEFFLFLNKGPLQEQLGPGKPALINVENWRDYFSFLRQRLLDNRRHVQEAMFSWLETTKKIESTRGNLEKYASLDQVKEHRVNVVLESAGTTRELIALNYLQKRAGWHPAYTLRANPARGVLDINVYAMVRQESGEDWENIALLLSTAVPLQNCDIPAIFAKRIKERDTDIIEGGFLPEEAPGAESDWETRFEKASIAAPAPDQRPRPSMDMLAEPDYTAASAKESKKVVNKGPSKKERLRELLQINRSRRNAVEKPALQQASIAPAAAAYEDSWDEAAGSAKTGHLQRGDLHGLVSALEQKTSPRLSVKQLAVFYQELDHYLKDQYRPEDQLPATREPESNQYFARGVSPLESLGGYDYRYRASSTKNTIPSLDRPVQIGLDNIELALNLSYITIPVEKELVYLKALFKNSGEKPLPAGPAQVFIENGFLGNIALPTLGLNQGTALSLGRERDIKVLRKEVGKRRTKGVVTKEIVLDYKVIIELVSYKPQMVMLEVYDRIPQPGRNKEIAVFDIKYSLKPDIVTKQNIVVWKKQLAPKKKEKIEFYYSIKHPVNYRLTLFKSRHAYPGIME